MRTLLTVAFLLVAHAASAQQPEQVVTPVWVQEHTCTQSVQVPCETPCPSLTHPCTSLPPTPAPAPQPTIHYEMRSKALFWGGVGLVGGGAALIVGSMTWARDSEVTPYPSLPCGTDPYFAQKTPVAACKVSVPLLAAGASLAGSGSVLMFYGGRHVAVGTDGRQVKLIVRF